MIAADYLKRIAAWSRELNDRETEVARAGVVEKSYRADEFIFMRGDRFDYWTGIVTGLARMGIVSRGGKATSFTGLTAGSWFGEGTVIKREVYRYNIQALRRSIPEYQPLQGEFLAQRKILAVDDDPKMCELLAAILKDSYEVLQAADAAEAIAKAREALPDLIFLDVKLPGVDGYSVCQTLKADPRTQPIPIIMLSALADVNEKVRGIDLGADDYITKPFDAQELRASIQMILRRASVR